MTTAAVQPVSAKPVATSAGSEPARIHGDDRAFFLNVHDLTIAPTGRDYTGTWEEVRKALFSGAESHFTLTDPITAGTALFSNGTDASISVSAGQGGSGPTAGRVAKFSANAPDSVGNRGSAYLETARNSVVAWRAGSFPAVTGVLTALSDFGWDPLGNGVPVMGLTTAGALSLAMPLAAASGGTGFASYTIGDVLYATGATTLAKLPIGAVGEILRSTGTAISWTAESFPSTAASGDLLYASAINTWSNLAIGSNTNVILGQSGGFPGWTAQPTLSTGSDSDTQLTVGSGGAAPTGNRTAYLLLNAPSSVGNLGRPRVVWQRNGTEMWHVTVPSTAAGTDSTTNDLSFRVSGVASGVVSFTQAGQVIALGATLTNPLLTTSGGTGLASYSVGDTLYYAASTALSKLAIGGAGTFLRSTGTAPSWSTATFPGTATAGDVMIATATNVWGSLAIGANANVVLSQSGGLPAWTANPTMGGGTDADTFVTIGSGGAAPTVTRTSTLVLSPPDSNTNHGRARIDFRRNGSSVWIAGIDEGGSSGAKANVTDWALFGGGAYRFAVTTGGSAVLAGNFTIQSSNSGALTVGPNFGAAGAVRIDSGNATGGVGIIVTGADGSAQHAAIKTYSQITKNSYFQSTVAGLADWSWGVRTGTNAWALAPTDQLGAGDVFSVTNGGTATFTNGTLSQLVYSSTLIKQLSATGDARFFGARSEGTVASPTALANNQGMMTLGAQGYDGSAYQLGGFLQFISTQLWSGTARGTKLELYLTPSSSTTAFRSQQWNQDGSVVFGPDPGGSDSFRVTSNATFSAGTDASTLVSVGRGGGAPTAARAVGFLTNVPDDNAANYGSSQWTMQYAGTELWRIGFDRGTASSGVILNRGDFHWKGSSTMVMALSTAGLLVNKLGYHTLSGAAGTFGTHDNHEMQFVINNVYVGQWDVNGSFNVGTGAAVQTNSPNITVRAVSANGIRTAYELQQINAGTSAGVDFRAFLADSAGTVLEAGAVAVQKSAAWTNGGAASTFMSKMLLSVLDTNVKTTYLTLDANAGTVTSAKPILTADGDSTHGGFAFSAHPEIGVYRTGAASFGVTSGVQFGVQDGSSTAPSLNFVNAGSLGFFRNGTINIVMTAGSTDTSASFSVGVGGGAPTASRTTQLLINTPDSGSFRGVAWVSYQRASSTLWSVGIDSVATGPANANTDFTFVTGGASVGSLTSAGQFRSASGFVTKGGAAGSFGTVDNFSLNFLTNNATVGFFDNVGNLLIGGANNTVNNQIIGLRTVSSNSIQTGTLVEQVNTGTNAGIAHVAQLYDSASTAVIAGKLSWQKSAAWTNGGAASTFMSKWFLQILDTNVLTTYLTIDANAGQLTLGATTSTNYSFGGAGSFGGGKGVQFISNANTDPTTNPSGGGILYASSGALKWRGSSGTLTTLGPAEPHCPVCGSDFGVEYESPKYGYLALCLSCLSRDMGDRPYIRRHKHAGAA